LAIERNNSRGVIHEVKVGGVLEQHRWIVGDEGAVVAPNREAKLTLDLDNVVVCHAVRSGLDLMAP
jgi:hypothetical protein